MVEYDIDHSSYNLKVYGPNHKWLHVRLMCVPGCKYDKKEKAWIIPRCWLHIVTVVIQTHLNNLAKTQERKATKSNDEDDWLGEVFS